ncbi:MAG: hypothetical protein QM571_06195 [Micrococcaceae bacterium]
MFETPLFICFLYKKERNVVNTILIRQAQGQDLSQVMEIINQAKQLLKADWFYTVAKQ